ncbi:rRNA processing protein-like protein isoform X2 [Wolffia australiana]
MGSATKSKRLREEPEETDEEDFLSAQGGPSDDEDLSSRDKSDLELIAAEFISQDEDDWAGELPLENEEDEGGESDGSSEDEAYGEVDDDVDAEGIGRLKANGGAAEMDELEKEYENLRHQEQTILSGLKRQKDDDFMKGQSIRNQKALWNKNLEFRFLLQKPFSNSNNLPREPLRSQFSQHDEAINTAYEELILSSEQTLNSMLDLQEALIKSNASIPVEDDGTSNKVDLESDDIWWRIISVQRRFASFRNNSIDRWQRKTQVTSGAAAFKSKLQAFNQNIGDQVAALMRDPSRMIDRMMLHRSSVNILGESAEGASASGLESETPVGDPELIDDSEFYQQLLKEFFETYDLSTDPALYSLKKGQTKKRKIVDRRASKSRKIRYHVHEKIVNFMAPKPMILPPMAPQLFENLFGLRRKTAKV